MGKNAALFLLSYEKVVNSIERAKDCCKLTSIKVNYLVSCLAFYSDLKLLIQFIK